MSEDTQPSTSGAEEDFDVREVHGQIIREKAEPHEMLRAAPAWLKHGIYAPLLVFGLIYLINASGGFHWSEYYEGARSTLREAESAKMLPSGNVSPVTAPEGGGSQVVDLVAQGEQVYQTVCIACHQANGAGLAGAFPPLAGSDWVAGNEHRLALIVLHGLMGPIEVNGQPWNSVMPPLGATLGDEKIAAVLSFVRSSWGNSSPEVSPELVKTLRSQFDGQTPWTAETLQRTFP